MSNTNLSLGIKEITINGRATLRFNPSDPSLYERFCKLLETLQKAEERMTATAKSFDGSTETDRWGVPVEGHEMAQLIMELDSEIKENLRYVFGESNDFNDIFEGVNSFAGTDTGEWVITNFLNAIRPEIESSTQQRMKVKADIARKNREHRKMGHKA